LGIIISYIVRAKQPAFVLWSTKIIVGRLARPYRMEAMMNIVFDLELILRLVVAAFLGYVIGLERRLTGHAAGDRTFALTALGSALFTVVSVHAFPVGDTRIAAGVVTGLGFLGAGMIFKSQDKEVKGLTSAAAIWTVGAIGLAVGAGSYGLAIAAAALTLFLLASEQLLHIDQHIEARRKRQREKRNNQSVNEDINSTSTDRS